MRITQVRVSRLEGILEHPAPFWEDIADSTYPLPVGPGRYQIAAVFVEVETNEGVTGLGGPIDDERGRLIAQRFAPLIAGADPCATEQLWERLDRAARHEPDRRTMGAISALDCALWDLKAKWLQVPVYRLLGGPTRTEIPAYASADGYSLRPELVRRRAAEFVAQGYRAMKWFFRYGGANSTRAIEDMREDLALARALREAVGDGIEIMLDAVSCWDVPYTLAMLERLAEYRPAWLEDPLHGSAEEYALVRKRSSIPIAAGERRYTRSGLKQLLDAEAVDILQPDFAWAGGISEAIKICAIAANYGARIVPHVTSVPATVHVLAAQPAALCPTLEYLPKWQAIDQFFYTQPLIPEQGVVRLSELPGLGVELDEAKIRARHEIRAYS
jgi:L-rhamnonate dehydratase